MTATTGSEPCDQGRLQDDDPDHTIVPCFRVADIDTAVAHVRERVGEVGRSGAEEAEPGRYHNCRDPHEYGSACIGPDEREQVMPVSVGHATRA